MSAPRVTVRLRVARELMDRIQEASHDLDVLPSDLIERAVIAELNRHAATRRREQTTLEALQRSVLAGGQSIRIETEAENPERAVCPLCLREIPRPRRVDGPLLCDACYALAQGERSPGGQGA